jgi:3D (Asp-Asp-Asp) domain-containing protein
MSHNNLKGNAPKNNYLRDLITSWVIVFCLGLIIGGGVTSVVFASTKDEPKAIETVAEEPIEPSVDEYVLTEEDMMLAIPEVPSWEWEEPIEEEKELLGNFRITAYCSCKKCCGKWADNRPNGIVYGASGAELVAGVSVASPLPFGTEIYIDGLGDYVVQDRLAKWVVEKYGENLIDVYFDNHEEACQFGLKYLDVYERGNNK